jgi:hypothetical protein
MPQSVLGADQTYLTDTRTDPKSCQADEAGFPVIAVWFCIKRKTLTSDPVVQQILQRAQQAEDHVKRLEANVKALSETSDALTRRLELLEATK